MSLGDDDGKGLMGVPITPKKKPLQTPQTQPGLAQPTPGMAPQDGSPQGSPQDQGQPDASNGSPQDGSPQGSTQDPEAAHAAKGTFNGKVEFGGTELTVKNGILTGKNGKKCTVSNDGHIVADLKTRAIIGRIEDGKFYPLDDAHLAKLKAAGALE